MCNQALAASVDRLVRTIPTLTMYTDSSSFLLDIEVMLEPGILFEAYRVGVRDAARLP